MRVIVQYQEAKKPYLWRAAFVGTVLYQDHDIILVRGAGSHSVFTGSGHYKSVGMKRELHERLPTRTKGYRIHPASMERLVAAR